MYGYGIDPSWRKSYLYSLRYALRRYPREIIDSHIRELDAHIDQAIAARMPEKIRLTKADLAFERGLTHSKKAYREALRQARDAKRRRLHSRAEKEVVAGLLSPDEMARGYENACSQSMFDMGKLPSDVATVAAGICMLLTPYHGPVVGEILWHALSWLTVALTITGGALRRTAPSARWKGILTNGMRIVRGAAAAGSAIVAGQLVVIVSLDMTASGAHVSISAANISMSAICLIVAAVLGRQAIILKKPLQHAKSYDNVRQYYAERFGHIRETERLAVRSTAYYTQEEFD